MLDFVRWVLALIAGIVFGGVMLGFLRAITTGRRSWHQQ